MLTTPCYLTNCHNVDDRDKINKRKENNGLWPNVGRVIRLQWVTNYLPHTHKAFHLLSTRALFASLLSCLGKQSAVKW